ncbi:ABC transporter ATP-binding protein [candidate division KSB1 bacterium]|nr:ABC transporter ATP-binding protein [candidate division KSB1 bacterium]
MTAFEEQEYNKKFDFGLWKRYLRFAIPYKKDLLKLALVMIAVGVIDAIFPMMSKYAVDHFIVEKTLTYIEWFAIIYFVLIAFQGFNVRLLIGLAGKIDMHVCYDIRKAGFQRLQELSFTYYDKTPVGWLMARMTSDVRLLGDVIAWGLVDSVWGLTMMTATMSFMLYLHWKLALVTMTVMPALIIFSMYFQQKILKAYRKVRRINSRITGAFNEGIMGAKTTKTLVREAANLQEFRKETSGMFESSVRAAIFSSLYLPVVLTLGSIGTGLALWYGGERTISGMISYGTLVAFISYTIQFFEPVHQLARIFAELQAAQASVERTLSMIETEAEIEDSPEVVAKYGDVFHPKRKNWHQLIGNISFRNVTFGYKEGERVLDKFNLDVRAGETVALVGETGSGKSTIINLACRFYEPTEGSILIDGVDYRQRSLLWLHSNLGYVLQTPHLFSGTIMENIRYGRLNATDDEVIQAAKLVDAHRFILELEKGYKTDAGEGGERLSTGQKQLVSFARAILANPAIFVLDEATSSVDTETEKIIQEAIQTVLDGRTSFIIAHRLSTIRSADRILVIQKGKITEEGNHHELMDQMGYYHRLYTNQFLDEQETMMLNS